MTAAVNDPGYAAVAAVLGEYFDGLYYCDTARLGRVFHPQARYACATDGSLLHLGMGEYFPIVEKREPPASRNETRRDRIVEIRFAGPVTAFAHVECAIGPKFFNDFLTLIKIDGRWQIISKVFHYDLTDDA
ncbi:nuclear transport factor 2 family protein [Ferrovibrio sp.]|uniref:nuclear transport factor 2 family protein n=1 Tax=Ferrovibrio sp. TaxID=1917215 RepID=UPI00311EC1D9